MVYDAILKEFAGPAEKGVFSPSVQNTLYLVEKSALDSIPEVALRFYHVCVILIERNCLFQISYIEMILPNKHYVNVDLSKFPKVGYATNDEVLQPLDKPSGNIRAALTRTPASKL